MSAPRPEEAVDEACRWSGDPIPAGSSTTCRDVAVGFYNPSCRDRFEVAARAFDRAIESR